MKNKSVEKPRSLAFIDASNLFYGGRKSLGWEIDYQRFLHYLRTKYNIKSAFYFGGVEIHNFEFDYLTSDSVQIEELEAYLLERIKNEGEQFNDAELLLFARHLQRVRFYLRLKKFGYSLYLKPVKSYEQEDGTMKRKANCDVEMAFYLMKERENFDRVVVLSGDGDFLPVLKYLRDIGKEVIVLARGPRTAREIRRFAGSNFRDFEYLRYLLSFRRKQKKGLV